jgi:hypothetical protein
MQATAVTSAQMWATAAAVATVDLALAAVLTHRLRPPWRPRFAPTLLCVGIVGFATLFSWAFWAYWDSCYGFALPAAAKPFAPLVGMGIGASGWIFWRVARWTGRWAVPVFVALGGLESLPGHLNAIYRFDLLERCPLIQGVSPASALVFGIFEFGFYWSMVLTVSSLVTRIFDRPEPAA